MIEIVITGDGSHTLYNPVLDEHYHSVHGALTESLTVFIRNGYCSLNANPVKIFEAGFGTGLNVLLTLLENLNDRRIVYYETIDAYPPGMELISKLNYPEICGGEARSLFRKIHSARWNEETALTENFRLKKINTDIKSYNPSGTFNLIYFDAFGPAKQPEMWTEEIIGKIAGITENGGIFVTYSVKGEVRRLLGRYGFKAELLPGPPHKRHVLRALKY